MDALPVSTDLAAELVAEANTAFQLNIGLFHELDALMGLTAPLPLPQPAAGASPSEACPFAKYLGAGLPEPEGLTCPRLAKDARSGDRRPWLSGEARPLVQLAVGITGVAALAVSEVVAAFAECCAFPCTQAG